MRYYWDVTFVIFFVIWPWQGSLGHGHHAPTNVLDNASHPSLFPHTNTLSLNKPDRTTMAAVAHVERVSKHVDQQEAEEKLHADDVATVKDVMLSELAFGVRVTKILCI